MPASIRILIVEDNPHDAALAEREVRKADVVCTFRRVDTREGMEAALRDDAPDVILTDHSLPNFSARDALAVAQQRAPGTPVIIVTGRLGDEPAVEYLQLGAADYIVKDHLHRLGPAVLRAIDTKRSRDEQARAHQLQDATFRIAQTAIATPGLHALLPVIHQIVGELMPAKNLYIALYDPATDLLSFPYAVDEHDTDVAPRRPGKGLTEYVLRTGEPLLVTPEVQAALEAQGQVELVGSPSIDWLGVPLKIGDRTIGVLAVQSYTAGVRYDKREQDILQFVSAQVALAIERSRAEDQLRQSEAHHRTVLEHIVDAVFVADREGRFLDVNPRACQLTGYTREELLGRAAADTYPPGQRAEAQLRLGEIAGGGPTQFFERQMLRKDGSEIAVEMSVGMLPDGRLLATARDVTERRQLELQLRQSQKLEAVGRLAGGVAHDFNNVLTAVFGYVDLLREGLPAGSRAHDDLEEVRKAAERAAGLTKQLLAFSRQQVLEPVVLQPNALIEDFEKMLRRVIGEDIALRLALAADVGNVRADPGQLHQVVMNLVVNARDAMPTGGSLIIETANAELSEHYAEQHRPVVAGRYVLLAVSDTGSGMTPEVKARIFEPFFTTKEKGKGTGLGLSTVYGIVKQSGGYIWAYSEVGRGTTFKIYLPRVDAPAERVAKPREAGSLAGTETILLAEDDAMLRPLARSLLEKLGYRVIEGETAEAALAAARTHHGPIHLLLADVVLPRLSGRELAKQLASLRPETKVLYMSGYTDDAIVHHGMLEPGLNFLQKPFMPNALARRVREVLDAPKGKT